MLCSKMPWKYNAFVLLNKLKNKKKNRDVFLKMMKSFLAKISIPHSTAYMEFNGDDLLKKHQVKGVCRHLKKNQLFNTCGCAFGAP